MEIVHGIAMKDYQKRLPKREICSNTGFVGLNFITPNFKPKKHFFLNLNLIWRFEMV